MLPRRICGECAFRSAPIGDIRSFGEFPGFYQYIDQLMLTGGVAAGAALGVICYHMIAPRRQIVNPIKNLPGLSIHPIPVAGIDAEGYHAQLGWGAFSKGQTSGETPG